MKSLKSKTIKILLEILSKLSQTKGEIVLDKLPRHLKEFTSHFPPEMLLKRL